MFSTDAFECLADTAASDTTVLGQIRADDWSDGATGYVLSMSVFVGGVTGAVFYGLTGARNEYGIEQDSLPRDSLHTK